MYPRCGASEKDLPRARLRVVSYYTPHLGRARTSVRYRFDVVHGGLLLRALFAPKADFATDARSIRNRIARYDIGLRDNEITVFAERAHVIKASRVRTDY